MESLKHLFQTIALVLLKIFWSMNQYYTSKIETPHQFKGQMWGVRADKGWDLLMETCPHTKYFFSKLEFWRYTRFTICIPDYLGCIDIFHIYYICNLIFYHLSKTFFSINIFPVKDIARENLCSALTDGRSTPTNKHSCHKLPVAVLLNIKWGQWGPSAGRD